MVDTVARRMRIDFDEAETLAEDCARRGWAEHSMHSVRLQQAGREIAQDK
jgi:hypothetical protein